MPFELKLPAAIKKSGWKVKIMEKERLEPPHVTILYKASPSQRLGLRDGTFLVPPGGTWGGIPPEVQHTIESNWQALIEAWDRMYPENPVKGTGDD
jgi:hypothetical protein